MKKINVIAVVLLMAGVLAVCAGLVLKYHSEKTDPDKKITQQIRDAVLPEAQDLKQMDGGE